MPRTVARLLAESLEAHEVDQVYCVPGESYIGLTSALIERNSIRLVVCRHKAGAGYMAVADGRLCARAGVAVVSRGPGRRTRWGHCTRPIMTGHRIPALVELRHAVLMIDREFERWPGRATIDGAATMMFAQVSSDG